MITIWPQYLDQNLSLSQGRKVSKEIAVKEPTLSDIERALKRLGLTYTLEKESRYPGKWYEKSGRALVEWDKTKLELLKEVSLKINEFKK